jgi:hypothetical protein
MRRFDAGRNYRCYSDAESLTMTPPFVSILIFAGGTGPFIWLILVLLVAGAIVVGAICWVTLGEWIGRTRCRSWPTVSAVVDIVSVAYCEPDGSPILHFKASSYNPYYQATLTYIYHNPEEQMGDYSRSFGKKEDAEAWANSYKGETVKVYVDPRDPTRSMLREEDL